MKSFEKEKAILDDGCNPELVQGVHWDGFLEIPTITKPSYFLTPKMIVPFSQRNRCGNPKDCMICFNEMDFRWSEILIQPEAFIDDLQRFAGIISPDCSLYRNAPLAVQITNLYRNRAVGAYFQRQCCYVVPQIRCGSIETFSTRIFPEPIAFLGVEKHSIVAIGTYGCIQTKEDKKVFKAGLQAMLDYLCPEIVLVYGSMPKSIFNDFINSTRFIQYPDWISYKHRGEV